MGSSVGGSFQLNFRGVGGYECSFVREGEKNGDIRGKEEAGGDEKRSYQGRRRSVSIGGL